MPEEKKEGSQASTDDPKDTKAEDILYPGSAEDGNETEAETTARVERAEKVGLDKDAKEEDIKTAETKAETVTKELNDRAEKVGLKEGATEEEVKVAEDKVAKEVEDKKKVDENKPSVVDLHDAAITAVEKWQADPTPENKKLADVAVKEAKDAVAAEKSAKIEYDVKLPEGSLLPEDATEKIVAKAREQGFSNEVAQSMVDTANEMVMAQTVQAAKEVDEMVNVTWPKEASDDKEIGGDDFSKNAELSKRVLIKYAPPELVNLLDPRTKENPNGTSYGNNPHLMKFLVRLGTAMTDDQLLLAKGKGPEKKSVAEIFYGKDKDKDEKKE